jgi:GxxExxY protein
VIGAAIEVHSVLGPGYLESVYESAMALELTARAIPFQAQHAVSVTYKGADVGQGKIDFLAGGKLIVELKAVERVLPVHRAQVISYLRATGCRLGLLINFNERTVREGIQRIVLTTSR